MTKHIGVTLDLHTELWPGKDVVAQVKRHEEWGFESQWLSDAMCREPLSLASWLLANTTRIKIGTAIANMYGRDAMTAAQARTTLNELSGGRFLMGLGVSNEQINALRHAEWMPPAKKLRQYLTQMRDDMSISAPWDGEKPVYIAAHGPVSQKIACELADGIMTWTMMPAHIRHTRERLGPDKAINAQMACIFTEDPEVAYETARKYIPVWLSLPHYRQAWLDSGFTEADFENGGSARLFDALFGWGSPQKIREKIAEYHEAGATRVILEPIRLVKEVHQHPIIGDILVEGDFGQLAKLSPLL
jgi:probable F420-dependent oxidoreductase